MNTISHTQLDYCRESVLSEEMASLMAKRHVSKTKLHTFLIENRKELATFAIKTPVNWIVFGKNMKQRLSKKSELFKMFEKLEYLLSDSKIHFCQIFPRSVRQNIARQYPKKLNYNVESLIKIRQLLIGDYEYLKDSPKVQGIPLKNLVQWVHYQKVPLFTLGIRVLEELDVVLSKLHYVDLTGCVKGLIPYLFASLNRVSYLASDILIDAHFEYLVNFQHLKGLNLARCHKITDKTIGMIAKCTRLTHLTLSECGRITDEGVRNLLPLRQTLKSLDLSGCFKITDNGISLIGMFSELTYLNLKGCSQVTDKGAYQLVSLTKLKRYLI